jgi:hypothetical protein
MNDIGEVMKFGIGQPLRRFGNERQLTGRGRYQDDVVLPRQAWCVFVRSPHAHVRISGVDTSFASVRNAGSHRASKPIASPSTTRSASTPISSASRETCEATLELPI